MSTELSEGRDLNRLEEEEQTSETQSRLISNKMASLPEYYAGKSVLITGATGFMGKVLVEKLLRSCPDVKALYILVRPKAGQSMKQRVSDMMKCKLFDRVREENPDFHQKIIPISSELTQPGLSISSEDVERLTACINIVFHCAATIRFDEPLNPRLEVSLFHLRPLPAAVFICFDFSGHFVSLCSIITAGQPAAL
ncbi:cyclin-dependent kinase inhibitor far1 [Characodon lateralis]|uniref:Fatty acyl-CoA reductase n=1 Tax=Characodon lateralis TaxID=208331 RepID=A0ABU7DDC7_9TELE|nr:cyclin-dependent kinase inhibitor far1 [Characodon lateralis]